MNSAKKFLLAMVVATAANAAFAADTKPLPNEKQWQEAIERLSKSPDPKLAANKRLVMEAERAMAAAVLYGEVEPLMKYIHPDYVQHDPSVAPGREGLRSFFANGAFHGKQQPGQPLPVIDPPAMVFAEGDLVAVSFKINLPNPKDPTKTLSSMPVTAFRVADGKLIEHFGGSSMSSGSPPSAPRYFAQ